MPNIEISQLEGDAISISTLSSESSACYLPSAPAVVESDDDTEKSVSQQHPQHQHQLSASTPVIPSISGGPRVERIGIETSTDVTIGNQTYFQGTVIIKNLHSNNDPSKAPIIETKRKSLDANTAANSSLWRQIIHDKRKKRLLIVLSLIGLLLMIGLIALIVVLFTCKELKLLRLS